MGSLFIGNSLIASECRSARREGERIGIEKGKIIGIENGKKIGIEDGQRIKAFETARKLLRMGILSTEQIADATGLERAEIDKL
ncbi:hypothetical protein QUF75_04370 [Desulfococcaceae bacterium HSG7]|nr:hypothetical protein [Desulfococcaceae bacterium HSG7]